MNLTNLIKKYLYATIITLFVISRLIILFNPPLHYSDVKQDYERYANTWWYGLPPYLQHLYEYPPATIPLLVIPLLLDQLGIGKYYFNYRSMIFLFDIALFFIIYKVVRQSQIKAKLMQFSLGFYILAGLVAKDFYYDGLDLIFAGIYTIGLCSLVLLDQKKMLSRIIFWALFWWSVAIKFMTLPLTPLLFIAQRNSTKKEIIAVILGFLLVWAAPIAIYRSSLSVSVVFHAQRAIKYSSVPGYFVDIINSFTKTENRVTKPPDFQLEGPVSKSMDKIISYIFPLSIILVIIFGLVKLFKVSLLWEIFSFEIGLTLIYFSTIFLTAKTFSQPFPIWLIPLVAVYPVSKLKLKTKYMAIILFLLLLLTFPMPGFIKNNASLVLIKPITLEHVIQTIRVMFMFIIWWGSLKWLPIWKTNH